MTKDPFLILPPTERRLIIEEAALNSGKGSIIFEKDFWVCWLLLHLFNLPDMGRHLTFKGGTSLSKVYGIVGRMSEDIDLSFHRSYLGFEGDKDPERVKGNERNRRLEQLQEACIILIQDSVIPALKKSIADELDGEIWSLETDQQDLQTLYFTYPTAGVSFSTGYINPVVKIEFGARSDNWPQETRIVRSYLAETYTDILNDAGKVELRVLTVGRTFWEKATILHAEAHRSATQKIPGRYSRHYYDLFKIIQSSYIGEILNNMDLLDRVASHKMVFFRSKKASYETAKSGSLKLIPKDIHIAQLEEDYEAMQPMFFEKPPAFKQVLEGLKELEEKINK